MSEQQIIEALIAAAPGIRNGNVSELSLFKFFAPVATVELANPSNSMASVRPRPFLCLCAISDTGNVIVTGSTWFVYDWAISLDQEVRISWQQFASVGGTDSTSLDRSTLSGQESSLLDLYCTSRTGETRLVRLTRTRLTSQL